MDFDYIDYIVVYDRKYDSGLMFLKNSFKEDDVIERIVPIVYAYNHETCLGYAQLDYREDGVVAYCKFNESDIGRIAKDLVVNERACDVSFLAVGIKRKDGVVESGRIRAAILTMARPKILEDSNELHKTD